VVVVKQAASGLDKRIRSLFPDEAIARIQVVEYGDAPEVEPGETGIRVFVSRAGRPEGEDGDEEIVHDFEGSYRAVLEQLRGRLPRNLGWVEFRPDTAQTGAKLAGPALRIGGRGGRAKSLQDVGEDLTPVMTRLGELDLTTVDTLITAGIASSRAEVLRWAVSRIREHPTYSKLQERVREINDLKNQF
jgi:hypothetical protein